jgi:hypothetical protein
VRKDALVPVPMLFTWGDFRAQEAKFGQMLLTLKSVNFANNINKLAGAQLLYCNAFVIVCMVFCKIF